MIDIDVTDFDEALQQDRDGAFHRAVELHLEQALADHRAAVARGISPADFQRAAQIEAALLKATDVVRFSQNFTQSNHNPQK